MKGENYIKVFVGILFKKWSILNYLKSIELDRCFPVKGVFFLSLEKNIFIFKIATLTSGSSI